MTEPIKPEIPDALIVVQPDREMVDPENGLSSFQIWLSNRGDLFFRLGLISFVIAFVIFGVFMWLTGNLNVENVGYGGIWVVNFIAAGTIILPLPFWYSTTAA